MTFNEAVKKVVKELSAFNIPSHKIEAYWEEKKLYDIFNRYFVLIDEDSISIPDFEDFVSKVEGLY
jgi:hypothetical protein